MLERLILEKLQKKLSQSLNGRDQQVWIQSPEASVCVRGEEMRDRARVLADFQQASWVVHMAGTSGTLHQDQY